MVILGPPDLASQTPLDASTLYARNVFALVHEIVHDGVLQLDLDDEIVAGALLTHDGAVRHAPTADKLQEVAR